MSDNQQVQVTIDKEVYDAIQMLKEILPEENWEKLSDNEVLKMVVGTFMAFIQGDDEENQTNEDCDCENCHCH